MTKLTCCTQPPRTQAQGGNGLLPGIVARLREAFNQIRGRKEDCPNAPTTHQP